MNRKWLSLPLARIIHAFGRPEGVAQTSSLLYRGFPIRRRDQAGAACRLEVGDTVPIQNREKPALRSLGSPVPLFGYEIAALVSALACLVMAAGGAVLAAEPASAALALASPHMRVLLVTGVDYPGHLWRQTAPVLADAIRKDPRLEVFTVEDPHFLDSAALARYDVVVLHFENWEQPAPGLNARENLRRFVEGGKGVVLLHFACGAWHDEWPEFVNIAGRVWGGQKVRQHDPYGPFRVEIVKPDHPLVRGMAGFDTQDELYTCLTGEVPIQVLAQAKSKVDGKYYPMAFVADCGKGRSFHCTLGHNVQALSVPAVQELFRRGCAWAAGLPPGPAQP